MFNPSHQAPKYFQLKEHLKRQIQLGEIPIGGQLPSENELAKTFALSRHTVRQAFTELEKEGLIHREQGRGTFCSPRAKGGSRTIAVLTTYISDYIFPIIIRGIDEILSTSGYVLLLANTDNDKAKEAQCLENLLGQDIAGLIIEPTKSAKENVNMSYYAEIERRGIPYLMIHAAYLGQDPAHLIMDDAKGAYLATEYLVQLGHREIAGIFKGDDIQGLKRKQGFLDALAGNDITPSPELLGNYDTEQMEYFPLHFTQGILQRNPRPTALVCYNDQIALLAMEAIRNAGLRIPEDISLVGYDDSGLAVATETKLTTVKHPKIDMGRQAARFIVDMVEGRVEKPSCIYQPELIIRASCRRLG